MSVAMNTTVEGWIRAVHGLAIAKGWWPDESNEEALKKVGEKMMLVVSEISEAYEEWRKPEGDLTTIYFLDKEGHRHREQFYAVEETFGETKPLYKPEGFPIELADAVIRIFDLAGKFSIPLRDAMALKHEYNVTRPHRHGGKKV